MKPRGPRRPHDPFADETTVERDAGAVPMAVVDEDTTMPVDVDEMAAAARRSREVPDPHEPRLHVELALPGAPPLHLPVHRVSGTGAAVAVPEGVAIALAEDARVAVEVVVERGGAVALRVRIAAHVAHYRPARPGGSGGLSLRWDARDPTVERAVAQVLAVAPRSR